MEAAATLAEAGGGGKLQFEGPAWNGSTVDAIRLAKAHGYLVLVQTFFAHVAGLREKVSLLREMSMSCMQRVEVGLQLPCGDDRR